MTFVRPFALLCLGASIFLTGCDKTKEIMGLKRDEPDEYTIESRQPLSLKVPPSINLAPPKPGAKPLHDKDADHEAREHLGVASHKGGTSASAAEQDLLSQAHGKAETTKLEAIEKGPTKDRTDDAPSLFNGDEKAAKEAIDPAAEKKRLKDVTSTGPLETTK
ncbi:MAG: DUF3035 domain-containing protein [Alphaproteobacteria bacterium]|nr:DUF3035 domain-containing protein [Alphaproteobacteria bacterium]